MTLLCKIHKVDLKGDAPAKVILYQGINGDGKEQGAYRFVVGAYRSAEGEYCSARGEYRSTASEYCSAASEHRSAASEHRSAGDFLQADLKGNQVATLT